MNEFLGHDLAQRMSELAVRLQDEDSRDGTLRAIVHSALDLVPGTKWAGICLIQGKRVTVEASSHDLVSELDQLQNDVGEGPCLSAIHQQHTVRVTDLAKPDQPWPHFAATALERGVHSMMSLRLPGRRETLGALNLYAAQPDAFTPNAEMLAELVAQHAAIALAGATREHHLNAALVNRDVLGQAKGILMQRDRLTTLQDFQSPWPQGIPPPELHRAHRGVSGWGSLNGNVQISQRSVDGHRRRVDLRGQRARASADLLEQGHDNPLRPTHVGHPHAVLVLADAADEPVPVHSQLIDDRLEVADLE
jgi:putative methionine-R-sulfoxide reductase with GAF domain